MSLRTMSVQYVGKVLYLPKLECEVTLVVERDYSSIEGREFRIVRKCHVEAFDDGVDEAMDGEWIRYAPPTWYLSCGHAVEGDERPGYCSTCGAEVQEEVDDDED